MKSPALSKWLRRLVLTVLALLLVIAGMTEHFPPEPALTLIALGFLLGCMVLFSLWRFAGNRALRVQALVRDLLLMLVPAAMAVVAYANVTPIWVSRGRIFTDITQVPVTKVGLVFGTSARVKMWLDVNFLATRPQHIGDKIELPGRSHPGSY